ncbi:MAG: hypothetical protein D4R50_00485 [Actinomycetales bacterium]|nr:MAG: hypothetical protein D4R50_00485 [Actinomycetales bacterium]
MSDTSHTLPIMNFDVSHSEPWQPSIGELSRPLSSTVFVVLDLETSGGSPSIESLLPSFLEFLGPASEKILVAHNANFDLGFLKAAASHYNYRWPRFKIFDTVRLARSILSKDDVSDFKLSTLSAYFQTLTSPSHRALDDARATVEVLHGIFERFGSIDITTVEDVEAFTLRLKRQKASD